MIIYLFLFLCLMMVIHNAYDNYHLDAFCNKKKYKKVCKK